MFPLLSRRGLALVAALALGGCADADPPGPTLDGIDPVQRDGDLAPDAELQPEVGIEPETEFAPEDGLSPEATLQPDSSGT